MNRKQETHIHQTKLNTFTFTIFMGENWESYVNKLNFDLKFSCFKMAYLRTIYVNVSFLKRYCFESDLVNFAVFFFHRAKRVH